MSKLTVSNFSCIESADIELGDLTILIGPQASGKSVLSKLIYFANEILEKQYDHIEDGASLGDFRRSLEQKFLKLFPTQAWANGRFEIVYEALPYRVRITGMRKGATRSVRDKISIQFSEYFEERYTEGLHAWAQMKEKAAKSRKRLPSFGDFWRFKNNDRKVLQGHLQDGFFDFLLFIPAARSFFTSVGKAIAVFEHGGMLDPITVEFGRIFASLRESRGHRYFGDDVPKAVAARRRILMQRFFGGSIEFGREEEFLKTPDGRKVPFSVLSSGQQELLPLYLVLDWIFQDFEGSSLIFIEEPEAHLFPSSQADITNYLASFAANRKKKQKILLTTHSPYVLANINNLLKAGSLASRLPEAARSEINKIVPRSSWLLQDRVRAYALKDGRAENICKEDLIDAEYLDDVSGEIASQFSNLLEIEMREWPLSNASVESPSRS